MSAATQARVREIVAVTLAEIMADTGHYSVDGTTVRRATAKYWMKSVHAA